MEYNYEASRNSQENEIRALLSPVQMEQMPGKLVQAGAVFEGRVFLQDVYFCPEGANSFEEFEMYEEGSYSLRLRRIDSDIGSEAQLNVKVITRKGDYSSWEEHETMVASFDEALAILKAVGFKVFFVLEKTRHKFSLGEFSIVLEEIEDFGPVIEVEVMTSPSEIRRAKTDMLNFLSTIGVGRNQLLFRSVTNILMKQRSTF